MLSWPAILNCFSYHTFLALSDTLTDLFHIFTEKNEICWSIKVNMKWRPKWYHSSMILIQWGLSKLPHWKITNQILKLQNATCDYNLSFTYFKSNLHFDVINGTVAYQEGVFKRSKPPVIIKIISNR